MAPVILYVISSRRSSSSVVEEARKREFGCIGTEEELKSNKENKIDGRRVLLAITVEIEDGCVEHIEMREGDSAEAVATKFCRDHALPDQFISPLTEHIVSNIVNISAEDEEPVFYGGKEKSLSGDDSWIQQQPKKGGSGFSSPKNPYTSDQEKRSVRSCGCNQKNSGEVGVCSRGPENCISGAAKATKQMKNVRKLSERLLAPTLTSLAKRPQAQEKGKKESLESIAQRPISKKAKAVYMRLYAEFLRQKQRIEHERARNLEMYQETIEKDRAYVSKRSWRVWRMRGRTAKQYKNYGELLYSEGLNRREQLKKLIVKKQQEDELKELKELTLKPEISKRAKQIRRGQEQIWHRLQSPDKPRQDQLQELRNEMWEAKLMECTFKPRINPWRFSEKILHDGKDLSTSRFDQLFLDAENRRRRQAEYIQWYPEGVTFQPRINRNKQSHGLDMDDGYQEGTVFDRLLHYASKLIEKKQMWQQMASKPIDPATGQELFTPVTGRKPIYDRNTSDLPIGDFLYQLKNTMDRKKQWLAKREFQNRRNQASCQYVGSKSKKLLDGVKERRFQQIFDYLDTDKDGYVELETADLSHLADDVVEDVARLKKIGGGKLLDYRTFVDLMKIVQEKDPKPNTIHVVVKQQKHDDNPVHLQFKMDNKSHNLASRRRRFSSSRQWYKLILADKAKWQANMEATRKERESMEMKECTFRPEIQKKRAVAKVPHIHNEQIYHQPPTYHHSNIVEKQQREMHGFIFQEDNNGVPENFENVTTSASHGIGGHRESLSHADNLNPLGLLQSLKSLKQIVTQPVESTDVGAHQISHEQDFRQDLYHEPLYQYKMEIENLPISFSSDMPDLEQKAGLFVGLIGA